MIRTRTLALVVVFLLVALVITDTLARADGSRYTRYRRVAGTSVVTHVRIRTSCLSAEDSAAHLRLHQYGDGRAVYGCARRGY